MNLDQMQQLAADLSDLKQRVNQLAERRLPATFAPQNFTTINQSGETVNNITNVQEITLEGIEKSEGGTIYVEKGELWFKSRKGVKSKVAPAGAGGPTWIHITLKTTAEVPAKTETQIKGETPLALKAKYGSFEVAQIRIGGTLLAEGETLRSKLPGNELEGRRFTAVAGLQPNDSLESSQLSIAALMEEPVAGEMEPWIYLYSLAAVPAAKNISIEIAAQVAT